MIIILLRMSSSAIPHVNSKIKLYFLISKLDYNFINCLMLRGLARKYYRVVFANLVVNFLYGLELVSHFLI